MAAQMISGLEEAELDRLYGLPLERFTAERDALARRLGKEGKREAAQTVKRLRKPSLAAWVVNRLARERPHEIRALIDAAEALRRAHTGGADRFRRASAAEREALGALVSSARDVLAAAGRPATEATLATVAGTLEAAAASGERETLERGRLTRGLQRRGFEALAGLAAVAAAPDGGRRPARPGRATHKRRLVEEARKRVAAARARARDLDAAAAALEREASRARADAERAEEELRRAERSLQAARAAVRKP